MSKANPARIVIGGCGLVAGALFVLVLRGAASASAVRPEIAQRGPTVPTASAAQPARSTQVSLMAACATPLIPAVH